MSEEPIITEPKQLKFEIALPDREIQYEKMPVYKTVQKIVTRTVNTQVFDESGNEVSNTDETPEPEVTEEKVLATVDGDPDESGQPQKIPLSWKDILPAAQVVLAVAETAPIDPIVPIKEENNLKGGAVIIGPKPINPKQDALSVALPDSKVTADLIENLLPKELLPEDLEDHLKHLGVWGLGCPGNCGMFWEFGYEDMVPQLVKCPRCGVEITLVK